MNASVLHGTVVYHDELRQWLGLTLEVPVCKQSELQLVFSKPDEWSRAKSLRGCKVTITGKIYEGVTGYYSANLAVKNPQLEPDASCRRFPPEPDPSVSPIPSGLDHWRASITVDYRGKGHVNVRVWRNENFGTVLKPSQAFVHYMLNGAAEVVWFGCRKGFRVQGISQNPKGPSGLEAGENSGAALQNLEGLNTITFSCIRVESKLD